MSDPSANLTWEGLEGFLVKLYNLPHNVVAREERARQGGTQVQTAEEEAKAKIAEVKTGSIDVPQPEEFAGPRRFLRAVGTANRSYGGEWWFDEQVLGGLEQKFSRIYFGADRTHAIRDVLRELLAVSTEWNLFDELWALELPAGSRLTGLVSRVARQPLFATRPRDAPGNRMLLGHERQIYFPVKNPLWVRLYSRLR